jgi:hypothetical protein
MLRLGITRDILSPFSSIKNAAKAIIVHFPLKLQAIYKVSKINTIYHDKTLFLLQFLI